MVPLIVSRFARRCAWACALGIPTVAVADKKSAIPPDTERGEQLWLENCWHCHGKRALGDGPLSTAIGAGALAGAVPSDRSAWVQVIQKGNGKMPAYSAVFDAVEAQRILTWLDALDPTTGEGPSLAAKKAAKSTPKKASDGPTPENAPEPSPAEGAAPSPGEPAAPAPAPPKSEM